MLISFSIFPFVRSSFLVFSNLISLNFGLPFVAVLVRSYNSKIFKCSRLAINNMMMREKKKMFLTCTKKTFIICSNFSFSHLTMKFKSLTWAAFVCDIWNEHSEKEKIIRLKMAAASTETAAGVHFISCANIGKKWNEREEFLYLCTSRTTVLTAAAAVCSL